MSEHSNLRGWTARLGAADDGVAGDGAGVAGDGAGAGPAVSVHDLDRVALDSGVRFAAEHARRYVASGGDDDGWDGPRPIVLLYTVGRRSGQVRRNPLLCFEHEGERYVIGSKGGAPTPPEWYLNLTAEPRVHVRFGDDVYPAEARTVPSSERASLWPELVARYPMFGDYQRTTEREIPLVRLARRPS